MFVQSLLLMLFLTALPQALAANLHVNVVKTTGNLKEVSAKVIINAPPSFVWQTLTAYNELASFVPGYKKCKILSHQGNISTLDVDMRVSRFMPSYKYRVRVQENVKALRLNLKRISGDFKHMDGTYQLHAIENGSKTVVTYDLKIDSGVNIPGSTSVLKANVEKALSAVRVRSVKKHQKSLIGRK